MTLARNPFVDEVISTHMKKSDDLTTDRVLVRRIAKLAPFFSRWSVRLAAKSLATETHSETLVLKLSADRVYEFAQLVLSELGRTQVEDSISVPRSLRAVIGAGTLNLNPAVVDLVIAASGVNECPVTITAAAKEGLVKQQTAVKAIRRVTERLLRLP
jgi:hypothetical protein